MSDMPWFSVSIIACTPQFWPRAAVKREAEEIGAGADHASGVNFGR
jgi:hypothetical protein